MSHIHTLKLHQLRLGELSPDEEGRLRAHLAECALCASRLQHQHTARAAFQRAPMPEALQPQPAWWERLRAWWLPAAALVPAALAAAFVLTPVGGGPGPWQPEAGVPAPESGPGSGPVAPVAPRPAPMAAPVATVPTDTPHPAPASPPSAPAVVEAAPSPAGGAAVEPPPAAADDGLRSKGVTPRLEAWVQAGDSARPLYVGESLGAGSRVQLRYDPRGRAFVTLAGRDSDGVVEVYGTVPAKGPGLTAAPFALTLDGSAGEQVFFALCTDARPDPEAVKAAVGHNPVRLDGALVATVVVRKE